jgi:hypothetical protein
VLLPSFVLRCCCRCGKASLVFGCYQARCTYWVMTRDGTPLRAVQSSRTYHIHHLCVDTVDLFPSSFPLIHFALSHEQSSIARCCSLFSLIVSVSPSPVDSTPSDKMCAPASFSSSLCSFAVCYPGYAVLVVLFMAAITCYEITRDTSGTFACFPPLFMFVFSCLRVEPRRDCTDVYQYLLFIME